MKTKFLYIAALALLVSFTACENETPFDTQKPDDSPIILKPYNESGTGSFTYNLANPDTPLSDSVTVTPSKYTTVNWYLDGELVFTGLKIYMTFPVGKYNLTIEAVTEKGKRTERFGTITVHPYDTDPYAPAPSYGRYLEPGKEATIEGQNLNKVSEIIVATDVRGREAKCTVAPKTATAGKLTFDLPEIPEGDYYLRLKDAAGKIYGSDAMVVTNDPPEPPASEEKTIWEGNCVLSWGDAGAFVKLTQDELAPAAGKTICVYYDFPEAEYHNLRITSDWWGQNLVDQFDVTAETPNPFTFEYDERCQGIVASEGGAALIVGFGETITKVTYK